MLNFSSIDLNHTQVSSLTAKNLKMSGKVIEGKATPRGKYPHVKRVGDFIYVSGTSSRRPDNTFEGVEVDEMGTTNLDIKKQTAAVLENIDSILKEEGASLKIKTETYK